MTTVIGRATSMGWKRRKSGDKFEIVIELCDPPGWPIDVVWKATPIILDLESSHPPHVSLPGKVCGYHDGCPPDGPVCHLCVHLQPREADQ